MSRSRALLGALTALLLASPPAARAAGPGWGWPLAAPHDVVHAFDPPAQPWLPGHRGVDLRGRPGEPVRAAGAGTVAFAGPVAGVPVVSIRHPSGLVTTYEPVAGSVHTGDAVRRGTRIGRLVITGSHCAPDACLHWGLRRDDAYLDPLALLGLTRVRLLPLSDDAAGGATWRSWAGGGAAAGGAAVVVGTLGRRRRVIRRAATADGVLSRAGR